MNTQKTIRYGSMSLLVLLALAGTSNVFAVAGSTISNLATVNYDVGGVGQTLIESSPLGNTTAGLGSGADTEFIEDRLVNFTVTTSNVALVDIVAGGTPLDPNVAAFTVTSVTGVGLGSDSNGELDFILTPVNRALATANPFGAGTDNFDLTGLAAVVESGATAGYQSAEDTATFIDQLAPGASATVYVVGAAPGIRVDGDIAVVSLVATAAESLTATDGTGVLDTGLLGAALVQSAAADDPANIDNVFNEGAGDTNAAGGGAGTDLVRDGFHSDTSGYVVNIAELTVTKAVTVIDDPVNGVTNPKAIPGATVEYVISIDNAVGAATATSVTIDDDISAEPITFVSGTFNGGTCPLNPCGIEVTSPDVGVNQEVTNVADSPTDEGQFVAGILLVDVGSLDGGESATVTFRATVD